MWCNWNGEEKKQNPWKLNYSICVFRRDTFDRACRCCVIQQVYIVLEEPCHDLICLPWVGCPLQYPNAGCQAAGEGHNSLWEWQMTVIHRQWVLSGLTWDWLHLVAVLENHVHVFVSADTEAAKRFNGIKVRCDPGMRIVMQRFQYYGFRISFPHQWTVERVMKREITNNIFLLLKKK